MAEIAATQVITDAFIMPIAHAEPTPESHHPDPTPITTPEPKRSEPHYDSPLYTEINIPLPPLPGTPPAAAIVTPTSPKARDSRDRAHTLHSFSPFHRRRSSSPSATISGDEPVKHHEKRLELSMRGASKGHRRRSGTIDAAIVPAVMVLSAELFTPGEGDRGRKIDTKDRLEVIK